MTLSKEISTYLTKPKDFPPELLWWLRDVIEDELPHATKTLASARARVRISASPSIQEVVDVLVALGLVTQEEQE